MLESFGGLADRYLSRPYAAIFGIGIGILAVAFWLIVQLTPEQRQRARRYLWVFALVALLTGAAAVGYWYHASRPFPKTTGHFRIAVAPHVQTPTASAVCDEIAADVQHLLQSIHAQSKVEVLRVAPLVTARDAMRTMREYNTDALLWVIVAAASGSEGALYPRLYLRLHSSSLGYIELSPRRWAASAGDPLGPATQQAALETLESLEPMLPDWSDQLIAKTDRPLDRLVGERPGESQPVTLRRTMYAWPCEESPGLTSPDGPALPAGGPFQLTLESDPVAIDIVDEEGNLLRTVEGTSAITYTLPPDHFPPERTRLTQVIWACNHSTTSVRNCRIRMPWDESYPYVPGTLTVNGASLPDTGDTATVDNQERELIVALATLPAGHRVLVTSTHRVTTILGIKH